jgi:prepilin-type processing-associated H-X9-DG protein
LLIGGLLFLAGVSHMREAAKRAHCTNNLKQLGIAVDNYAASYSRFPSATVNEPSLAPERRLSWLVEMLPYMEGGPRPPYEKTKPWDAEENRPRWYRYRGKEGEEGEDYWGYYRLWLCPANPDQAAPGTPSHTHYVGIAGVGRDAASRPADAPAIGFFGYDRSLRPEDFKNGSSATLMAVETRLDTGLWTAGGYPTVRGLDPNGPTYFGKDGQFGGTHQGGVNTLFGDGTVRFLNPDVSPRAFEALATLAGGD